MKKLVFATAVVGLLSLGAFAGSTKSVIAEDEEDILYYADFEGKVVNANVPPDKVTDFIWAQEYLNCKTETHNGSNMLYMKAANRANDFSAFGGFGTASKSNLAKLRQGEPYQVTTYLEFGNVDFVEVEAICGGNKWGAIKVYADGNILADPGGNNIVDASYKNNILDFKFTYTFNVDEGVNGYITFKAFNSNNGYCYFDNSKIAKAPCVMEGTFEQYPAGGFDGKNDSGLRTILYTQTSDMISTSEIVEQNSNKFLRISYDCSVDNEQAVFYLNKMQFLNMDREYIFSFNLNTQNITSLSLRYGGAWISEDQQINIDPVNGTIEKVGDKIFAVSFVNNLVTIRYKVSPLDGSQTDSYQFEVRAVAINGQNAKIDIDNTRFEQIPVLSSISVNPLNAKTKFDFGDTFTYEGIVVTGHNSDGTTTPINASDCEYSGYDMNQEGNQIVFVTYQEFQAYYQINVSRVLSDMSIDTTNVKKNYGYGEKLDLTGLVVSVSYADGGPGEVLQHNALTLYGYAVFAGGFDSHKQGTYTIEIIYKHLKKSFQVTVSFEEEYGFDGIGYEGIGE